VVCPDLERLDQEGLILTGELKRLFAPVSGQLVLLQDELLRVCVCRVNPRGNRLRGENLGPFIRRLACRELVFTPLADRVFLVRRRDRAEAGAEQLKLFAPLPEGRLRGAQQPAPARTPAHAAPGTAVQAQRESSTDSSPQPATPSEPEVTVFLAAADDHPALRAAVVGNPAQDSDLQLRRQALELSVRPGFDTLLSLTSVRNVEPLDYQLATVRHVLRTLRGRALLCDEVGLGKTIEAGLILTEYLMRGLVRRVLILTPPSLVEQWREEMQTKFNLDFVVHDAPRFRAARDPWREFPRIIASLDTAKREPHRSGLLATEYDLVIVDEAHHLKNHRTQSYQLVKALRKRYILLLTATPVENDLNELFNLITLLSPGQLETPSSFRRRYINPRDPLMPRNAEALKRLLREVMVRNRRSTTGAIRSQRHAYTVAVDLSPEEEEFYRALSDFVRERYHGPLGSNRLLLKTLQREAGSSVEAVLPTLEKLVERSDAAELRNLLQWGRLIRRRSKAEALERLLTRIPEKVVVFTSFLETQRHLADWLQGAGFAVAQLHGGMLRQEKEDQVRRFAQEAGVLVSTETGSEGRNLQFCRVLVNYDLPWNPMRIEQRIGRLHRLGQQHDVHVWNLSARGTLESHLLELLDAKINMFQLVIGELDAILGHLGEEGDFEDIVLGIWARAADEGQLRQEMAALGERLVAARERYQTVRELDDRLLGELMPGE